jgi:hypothetical protein
MQFSSPSHQISRGDGVYIELNRFKLLVGCPRTRARKFDAADDIHEKTLDNGAMNVL